MVSRNRQNHENGIGVSIRKTKKVDWTSPYPPSVCTWRRTILIRAIGPELEINLLRNRYRKRLMKE